MSETTEQTAEAISTAESKVTADTSTAGTTHTAKGDKSEAVDMTYVKSLRHENMTHRVEKYELQEKLNKAESDFQTRLEDERSKAKEEAKQEAKLEMALVRFEALALKEGLSDPDVLALFDTSKFEFDDAGKIANAAELLAEFKSAKPHFFVSQATSSTTKAPKEATTTKAVKDMSREEYAAYKKAKGIS